MRLRSEVHEEDGFTLVELLVTMAVMSLVVTATFSVLFRSYEDSGITFSRAQAQNDGRLAMERMSKQMRQATNLVTKAPGQFVFDTYIDGTTQRVEFRVTTAGDLQTRIGTSGNYATLAEGLADQTIFGYLPADTALPTTYVTIRMDLETTSATIPLDTTVNLRNMEAA